MQAVQQVPKCPIIGVAWVERGRESDLLCPPSVYLTFFILVSTGVSQALSDSEKSQAVAFVFRGVCEEDLSFLSVAQHSCADEQFCIAAPRCCSGVSHWDLLPKQCSSEGFKIHGTFN